MLPAYSRETMKFSLLQLNYSKLWPMCVCGRCMYEVTDQISCLRFSFALYEFTGLIRLFIAVHSTFWLERNTAIIVWGIHYGIKTYDCQLSVILRSCYCALSGIFCVSNLKKISKCYFRGQVMPFTTFVFRAFMLNSCCFGSLRTCNSIYTVSFDCSKRMDCRMKVIHHRLTPGSP